VFELSAIEQIYGFWVKWFWARSSIFSVSLMAPVTRSPTFLASKDLSAMRAVIGGNDVQLGGF
jgi:hypothetical protein